MPSGNLPGRRGGRKAGRSVELQRREPRADPPVRVVAIGRDAHAHQLARRAAEGAGVIGGQVHALGMGAGLLHRCYLASVAAPMHQAFVSDMWIAAVTAAAGAITVHRALWSLAAIFAAGTALAVWPFIDQMNPAADTLALASTEVDLSKIEIGQSITVIWRGWQRLQDIAATWYLVKDQTQLVGNR